MLMMMMLMRMMFRSYHPTQKQLFPLLFLWLLLPQILLLFLQHQVPTSQAVAVELRQLVTQATVPPNNKSASGSFLHSNVPQIHDRVWPVYLKMEMENYIWVLNESDNIRERQQRQQQAVLLFPSPVQIPQL